VHVKRERWQWLESDHSNPKKKTRGNTEPVRERKDVASTPLEEKKR
jgi:hypothetical protein